MQPRPSRLAGRADPPAGLRSCHVSSVWWPVDRLIPCGASQSCDSPQGAEHGQTRLPRRVVSAVRRRRVRSRVAARSRSARHDDPRSGRAGGCRSATRRCTCRRHRRRPRRRRLRASACGRARRGRPGTCRRLQPKGGGGTRQARVIASSTSRADLEVLRADRRTEVGDESAFGSPSRVPHRTRRGLDDSGREATPSGMRHADAATARVGQQHRHAVGHHYHRHGAESVGERGIGFDRPVHRGGIDHARAVHLLEPARLGRQHGTQAGPV